MFIKEKNVSINDMNYTEKGRKALLPIIWKKTQTISTILEMLESYVLASTEIMITT